MSAANSKQAEEIAEKDKTISVINNKIDEKVKERTENLELQNQELDKFVYSASHDILAPIKTITGITEIAGDEIKDEKALEYFNYINQSANKLYDLIYSLTMYSRNNRMEIQYENIWLNELINELIDDLKFAYDGSGVELNKNFDEDLAFETDAYRLKIILSNLLSNAYKYTDTTKSRSKIDIDCKLDNTKALITVSDNGIGIDEEYRERIFDMFYRASSYSTGSGLGLYIVKDTVNKLGGEIDVDSEKYQGTAVKVKLPVGLSNQNR